MLTNYEVGFWVISTIGLAYGMFNMLRQYNINERRRMFGHD